MPNPNPILQAAESLTVVDKSASKLKEAQQQQLQQAASLNENIEEQIQIIGAHQAVSAQQASAVELRAQNNMLELYQILGGDEAYATMLAQRATAVENLQKTQSELDSIYEREPTGIPVIDDILNEFSASRTKSELRSDLQAVQLLDQNISNFAAHTESIRRVQAATKKTVNEATIAAAEEEAAANTRILANKARLASLKDNADRLKEVMETDSKIADIRLKEYNLWNSEEDRGFRVLNYEKSLKTLDLQIKRYEDQVKKDEISREAEDSLVGSIQVGQALAGIPVEGDGVIRGRLRDGKITPKDARLIEIGAGDGNLGPTPADAAKNLGIVDPGNLHPTELGKLLDNVAIEVAKMYDGKAPPKGTDLDHIYNTTALKMYSKYAKNIKEGDASNPYQAPPFAVLAESKAVSMEPLYMKVLQPANMAETSVDRILKLTVGGVQQKIITPEEAAIGINTIFSTAAGINNESKMFARGGLPVQANYNTEVKLPGILESERLPILGPTVLGLAGVQSAAVDRLFGTSLLSSTRTVDLTDYNQVQQLIIKLVSGTVSAKKGEE